MGKNMKMMMPMMPSNVIIIQNLFSSWKLCLLVFILTVTQISPGGGAGFRYNNNNNNVNVNNQEPFSLLSSTSSLSLPGCSWTPETQNNNNSQANSFGSLTCNVRTLNTDLLWNSSIPNSNNYITKQQKLSTVSIHIKCNDKLFFESHLSSNQSLFSLNSLVSIKIDSCKIRKLSSNINWRKLPNLKQLVIQTYNSDWSSSIELELESSSVFQNVGLSERLELLDLSFNNIWSLPSQVFCPLNNLATLNLSRNHLIEIQQEFGSLVQQQSSSNNNNNNNNYCSFNKLINLDLSVNSIRKIDSNAFSRLKKLYKLSLSSNYIDELEDDAFNGLSSLKLLNLTSNRLVALPPSIFKSSTELSEIYLSNNSISALSSQVFSSLQHLLLLDLSKNLLSTQWIKGDVFSGLIRLIVLKLSYNQLSFIDSGLFSQLSSLQALYLNNNRLERLDPSAFASLTNLHILDLSRNLLTFIDGGTFSNSYILKQLYLDHNRIRTIDIQSFHNCTSLQDLGLAGNLLLEVPLALSSSSFKNINPFSANNNNNANSIHLLQQLKTLDLGENKISFVSNESFAGLTKLYGLRMVDNRVGELPDNFCSSLKNLRVLNIGQNRLKRISSSAFNGCPELRALRLDKNGLEELPDSVASQLSKLLWLNLTENQLKYLNPSHLPQSLEWIDLSWNQLESLGDMYGASKLEDSTSSSSSSPPSQLRVLDASHNNLSYLDYRSIPSTLETLRLNHNKLKSIASDTFIRAVRLRRVELAHNEIETLPLAALRFSTIQVGAPIPEISFLGNPFLCHCDLEWLTRHSQLILQRQYPKIIDFDQLQCKSLPNSYSSSLNNNNVSLSTLSPTISLHAAKPSDFLCPYKTLCFPLCQCCEFEACDCNYQCPENCTCHHDTAWSSNIVQCSSKLGFENSQIPSRIPMDATQLYLDGNNFPTLSSHTFIGKRNLRSLYLNSSGIQILKNKTFNGLKSLEKLYLQNNLLTQFDGYEFTDLENLVELYLQNNLIKYITPNTFADLKLLQVLRLDGNLLFDFSIWELSKNSYLNSVMLSSNPWSCDCEFLIPFRSWVASRASTIVDFPLAKCQLNNNDKETGAAVYDNDHHLNQLQLSSSSPTPSLPEHQATVSSVLISSRCHIIEEFSYNSQLHNQFQQNQLLLNPSSSKTNPIPASNNDRTEVNNDSYDDDDSETNLNDNFIAIQEKFNKKQQQLKSHAAAAEYDSSIFWGIFLSLLTIMILALIVLLIIFRRQLSFWFSNHADLVSCTSKLKCISFSSTSTSSSSCTDRRRGGGRGEYDYDNNGGNDDEVSEKLFDAYFLYSRKDEDLLLYKICPELETTTNVESYSSATTGLRNNVNNGSRRLRLCLHFRDLCLNLEHHNNPWSPEMIQTACEVSRKVVILLSGSFIQTEWTNVEFRNALQYVLTRHQKKLIFILLPPLTAHNLVGLSTSYYNNNNKDGTNASSSNSSLKRNQRNLKGSTLEWTDENFWTKFKLLLPSTTTTTILSTSSAYSNGNNNDAHHHHHAHNHSSSTQLQRHCQAHLNNSINSASYINNQTQAIQCLNSIQQAQRHKIGTVPNYTVNMNGVAPAAQNNSHSQDYSWSASGGGGNSSHYFPNSYKGSQTSQMSPQFLPPNQLNNNNTSRYYANNNLNPPPPWSSSTPFLPQNIGNYSPSSAIPQYSYDTNVLQSLHSHNHQMPPIPPHQQQQLILLQQQQQNLPFMNITAAPNSNNSNHQHQNSISTISNTYRPLTEQNYSDSTNTLGCSDDDNEDDELNHIYSTLDSPILQSPQSLYNLQHHHQLKQQQQQQQGGQEDDNNSSSLTRIQFASSTNSLNHCLQQQLANNTNASSSGISSCEELVIGSSNSNSPLSSKGELKNLQNHNNHLGGHLRSASNSENISGTNSNNNANANSSASGQMYFV